MKRRILLFSQVVYVQMGELHTLYSLAWDIYAFLTHVVRDPVSYDISYRQELQSRAGVISSKGSESDQSNPYVA